jgi:hypothetical protein
MARDRIGSTGGNGVAFGLRKHLIAAAAAASDTPPFRPSGRLRGTRDHRKCTDRQTGPDVFLLDPSPDPVLWRMFIGGIPVSSSKERGRWEPLTRVKGLGAHDAAPDHLTQVNAGLVLGA